MSLPVGDDGGRGRPRSPSILDAVRMPSPPAGFSYDDAGPRRSAYDYKHNAHRDSYRIASPTQESRYYSRSNEGIDMPTIVDMRLDRPAAFPEIAEQATAVLASFGATEDAFLDVIFGLAGPEGKLPYDLPRSDVAVEANLEDVPFDTKDPVFKFGHGLRYNRTSS
ncbi:hypothetical protein NUW58_g382 [Xylaria curta]|uniref:Uncharacterized protein n=1 Tax=Xylaria curta TaxID=42375 RepID=A0ACC1PPH9_9PEZI|nr:hypothetical protein NUW58_g382 [Xylaria curta]